MLIIPCLVASAVAIDVAIVATYLKTGITIIFLIH